MYSKLRNTIYVLPHFSKQLDYEYMLPKQFVECEKVFKKMALNMKFQNYLIYIFMHLEVIIKRENLRFEFFKSGSIIC